MLALLLFVTSARALTIDELTVLSQFRFPGGQAVGSATLVRRGEAFVDARGGVVVSANAVDRLGAALDGPLTPTLTVAALTPTPDWLQEHVATALAGLPLPAPPHPSQAALFRMRFADPLYMQGVASTMYADSSASRAVLVRLTLSTREAGTVTLRSTEQSALMLPWAITRGGEATSSWDGSLSAVIADVLPGEFPNHDRVAGVDLGSELARTLLFAMQGEWRAALAETEGATIRGRIAARFTVESESAGHLYSDRTTERRWDAELIPRDGATRIRVKARFRLGDGGLKDTDAMLARIDADISLIASSAGTWFRAHPEVRIQINNEGSRSLNGEETDWLLADLRAQGLSAFADAMVAAGNGILSVSATDPSETRSRWVVLPDGRWLLHGVEGQSTTALWVDLGAHKPWRTSGSFRDVFVVTTPGG